jgi:hypothetical protein
VTDLNARLDTIQVRADTPVWLPHGIAADISAMVAALRSVLDLHKPEGTKLHWCENDGIAWPCPTRTAVTAALEPSL